MSYKDKKWLEGKISSGYSISKMALEAGCTFSTITNWLKKHDIDKPNNKIVKDREWLRLRYEVEELSIIEISELASTSPITVSKYIKVFNLNREPCASITAANKRRVDTLSSRYNVSNIMQMDSIKKKARESSFQIWCDSFFKNKNR